MVVGPLLLPGLLPPGAFKKMPEAGVTEPSSPSALAYALSPSSSVTLTTFQPLLLMSGYASMNAWTVYCESSCSRTIRPGFFGPVIHFVSDALTLSSVVLNPGWPMLQSSVLRAVSALGRQCDAIRKLTLGSR